MANMFAQPFIIVSYSPGKKPPRVKNVNNASMVSSEMAPMT
jgi:hypothetical protein